LGIVPRRRLWPVVVAGLAMVGGALALRNAPVEIVAHASDGDTLVMRSGEIVRVLGVDTPELHPCRCPHECNLGEAARAFTAMAVAQGVTLTRRGRDRYGRSLAAVRIAEPGGGENLADLLVRAGLGRPYRGGLRAPWCADAAG
jgi:endonuclease YncB( thermonuclease family)